MPALPFTITAVATTVPLSRDRRGQVSFTVANASDQVVRGRGSVVPLESAQAGWFSLGGPADRQFSVSGVEQYSIQIRVGREAAFGRYLFRLDMEATGQAVRVEGPTVAFEVTAPMPPEAVERTGYLETLGGAALGAVVAGALGAVPAALFGLLSIAHASVGAVLTVLVVGILLGAWIGEVAGAWMSLRIQGYDGFTQTASILAAAYPAVTAPLTLVYSLIGGMRVGGVIGLPVLALVCLGGPPLGARWVYLRSRRG